MAKQRYISTSIWDDDWFVEELNVSEKLFYFYLLTNEHTNIAGIYKISIRKISQESGFSSKDVREMFKTLQRSRKVYYMDEHVIMTNWAKHQNWEKSKKVHLGIRAILIKDVPQSIIEAISKGKIPYAYPIDTLSDGIDALPIPHAYPTNYFDSDSDSDSDFDSDSNFTNTCSELPQKSESIEAEEQSSSPVYCTIITNRKEEYPITEDMVDLWQESFPAVDVKQQLLSIKSWSVSNPKKRKTKGGMLAFVNNWLSREQNRPTSPGVKEGQLKPSQYTLGNEDRWEPYKEAKVK